MFTLKSQFSVLKCTDLTTNSTSLRLSLIPISCQKHPTNSNSNSPTSTLPSKTITIQRQTTEALTKSNDLVNYKTSLIQNNLSNTECPRSLIVGAASVGFVLLLMGMSDQKALAFGPEGPLVEEFWDNVRRYAIYALTVSTGALYTIFLPIFELLKNPISAILILVILGGGIYIVTQVVSAMVGITDFSYDYSY